MRGDFFRIVLKIIIFILFFNDANAQSVTGETQSSYIRLTSYTGVIANNVFGLRIHARGNNINIAKWTLTARIDDEIVNSEGKVFEPSKISIRINNVSDDTPTIKQMGANNKPISLKEEEFIIIKNSNVPIWTDSINNHKEFYFSFDIIIEGGEYLETLKSFDQYVINMVFSLKNEEEKLIFETPSSILMQVIPQVDYFPN